jgi:pseudaminic acid cytidylyltransferase
MLREEKRIAVIPARGGSKRIPKKNIKLFAGKPIIAYSINAALQSGLFDEIMVSTDDEEIADIAVQYGACIPFYRSKENADDYATTIDVLLETYNKYVAGRKSFNYICCIYACAPFVSGEQLIKAYSLLCEKGAETVFPVLKYGHPIQRALEKKDDYISMVDESNLTVRTQDLPPRFHDAGQFYWLTADSLLTKKKLITDRTIGIEISEFEAHDIDSELDWKLAELKFSLLQNSL